MPAFEEKGIGANHPTWIATYGKWKRCRDACSGSDAIKGEEDVYLPRLGSHRTDHRQGGQRYNAYKNRALWYNASRRTRMGLSGALTVRMPKMSFSNDAVGKLLAARITRLLSSIVDEKLETGFGALLVSQSPGGMPTLSMWQAESVVNWAWAFDGEDDILAMVVLEDEEQIESDDDEFTHEIQRTRQHWRLVSLIGTEDESSVTGVLYTKWRLVKVTDPRSNATKEEWEKEEPVLLRRSGGVPLDRIPAAIFGGTTFMNPVVHDPLLLDIVDVNISHYQNSADLEHGRHWCALPTAYASGFPTRDDNGQPITLTVGVEEAWLSDQPGASAGYLEFTGAGLGHIAQGMRDKQDQMAVLGSRLLEQPKVTVESAETIKVRMNAERSVLSMIAISTSQACTWALRTMMWMAVPGYEVDPEKDIYQLDDDFADKRLSATDLQALVGAMQAGALSYPSFFAIIRGADLIPPGKTMEEEVADIETGTPQPPSGVVQPPEFIPPAT